MGRREDTIKNREKIVVNNGFTLIELILVMLIIFIIFLMAIPRCVNCVDSAKKEVCNINCLQFEKMYEFYLVTEGLEHNELIFQKFLTDYSTDICPSGGVISYEDETVKCSIHANQESEKKIESCNDILVLYFDWKVRKLGD